MDPPDARADTFACHPSCCSTTAAATAAAAAIAAADDDADDADDDDDRAANRAATFGGTPATTTTTAVDVFAATAHRSAAAPCNWVRPAPTSSRGWQWSSASASAPTALYEAPPCAAAATLPGLLSAKGQRGTSKGHDAA